MELTDEDLTNLLKTTHRTRWQIVTPAQYKEGWIELQGVTPVHHDFISLGRRVDGNYVVLAPSAIIEDRT